MTVKHITPNDPEFHEIAKTITHVSRIRKDHLFKQTYIDAEPCNTGLGQKRRREDVDKLR